MWFGGLSARAMELTQTATRTSVRRLTRHRKTVAPESVHPAAVTISTVATSPAETAPLAHLKPRYSAKKVAGIFRIGRNTLRDWVARGLIKAVKISPHRTEFEVDEVERRYRELRVERPRFTKKSALE
jgi:hypothetical protein